jgi:branched-chain amino acid transport system substrate-binding protein
VIERVMTLSPEAVYLADYADGLARLIPGLKERGFRGMILTTSSFSSPEAIERAGAAAEGVVLTQSVFDLSSEDPQVQEFITDYEQHYDTVPDLYAAHGYDAMRVYAEALKEGRQAREVWQGMRGISGFDGVTGTIQFDEKGDVQKFPRVYVISDGGLLDYEQVLDGRRQELEERRRQLQERMQNLDRRQRSLSNDG